MAEIGTKLLETYLQHYVNYSQRNWVQLLPMAQMAYNNKETTIMRQMTFYANYGWYPMLFTAPRDSPQAINVLQDIAQLKQIYNKMTRKIDH